MYRVYQLMRVQKRNGNLEDVSFDKILARISSMSTGSEFVQQLNIDATKVAQKVIQEIYDGVETSELDILTSETAIAMYSVNPEYAVLASRILVSNHHKNTLDTFSEKVEQLFHLDKPLLNKDFYDLVVKNKELIDNKIDYSKDYLFDFFGLKTLEKSYLYKIKDEMIERPQDMIMRVCLSIHRNDLEKAFESYDLMSEHYFTHATPTLFNAGSNREQFASCFLLSMNDDSIDGIYKTLKDCALISQHSGGIGLHIHNVRAKDSFIAGTNGKSNGIVPMLRVFNDTARYVDQGGGKRNGSFAIYLEPWHADIFEFLELRKNHGNELERARDLFYALWIPDLFMKKVEADEDWYLFCPNESCNLSDYYGEDFVHKYDALVQQGLFREKVSARKLWSAILTSQIETGTPYLLYKDACNSKSNQKNLGVIKSSNLCTEIMEYSDKDETAVCNLASISLKKFVVKKDVSDIQLRIYSKPGCSYCDMTEKYCLRYNIQYEKVSYEELSLVQDKLQGVKFPQIYRIDNSKFEHIGGYTELEDYCRSDFDYDKLVEVTKIVTKNLNNIIDYNYYPTPETKRSNTRHRPIGIGVQGLANVFFELGIPFESDLAKELNEKIFESIYYGSMVASMNLAKEREVKMKILKTGMSQSPENGLTDFVSSDILLQLQREINYIPEELDRDEYLGSYSSFMGSPLQQGSFQHNLWGHQSSDRYDWSKLMSDVQKYGVRNSLLVAPMPTASTAQILGNYECFEPVMSNIYTRRVLAGDYMVLNEYLVNDLISLNLWSKDMKDKIIQNDGSIQAIEEIPNHFKARYKTVWEMKQKNIIDMAADRGKYICQSQSMNLFVSSPSSKILTSMHFYSWKKGLKTGIYYLRTRPSSKAIQFTVKPDNCEACSA